MKQDICIGQLLMRNRSPHIWCLKTINIYCFSHISVSSSKMVSLTCPIIDRLLAQTPWFSSTGLLQQMISGSFSWWPWGPREVGQSKPRCAKHLSSLYLHHISHCLICQSKLHDQSRDQYGRGLPKMQLEVGQLLQLFCKQSTPSIFSVQHSVQKIKTFNLGQQ